jgi:hypothetical protein
MAAAPDTDAGDEPVPVSVEYDRAADDDPTDTHWIDPGGDGGLEHDAVRNARRRHGIAGGILAAGMFGIDQALGRKPKEDAPVVIASSSDPHDIDEHGMIVEVTEDTAVVVPPTERTPPVVAPAKRRRW